MHFFLQFKNKTLKKPKIILEKSEQTLRKWGINAA